MAYLWYLESFEMLRECARELKVKGWLGEREGQKTMGLMMEKAMPVQVRLRLVRVLKFVRFFADFSMGETRY